MTQIFQTHHASVFLLNILKPVREKSERKRVELWPNADPNKISCYFPFTVVDEVLDGDNKVALRCSGYLQLAFSLCQDIIRKKGSVKRNLKPDLLLRNAF